MNTAKEEWIGVAEVAAEMNYAPREAWEYVRRIGLVATNTRRMRLARFTRAEFEDARERAKKPIAPRARTGALASAGAESQAKSKPGNKAAEIAALRAKLRGA